MSKYELQEIRQAPSKGGGLTVRSAEDIYELATVFHAGTKVADDGTLLTNGGRVLNVTALAGSFEAARARAYEAAALIQFEGKQFRTDIGAKAARGRSAWD